jgi:hypothetical protein
MITTKTPQRTVISPELWMVMMTGVPFVRCITAATTTIQPPGNHISDPKLLPTTQQLQQQ